MSVHPTSEDEATSHSASAEKSELKGPFGRVHDDLRVSVTDRCNLRCGYCMPPEGIDHVKKELVLSYEEILRVLRVAVTLGIRKVRITGGEPLVRSDIMPFIRDFTADGTSEVIDRQLPGIAWAFSAKVSRFQPAHLRNC